MMNIHPRSEITDQNIDTICDMRRLFPLVVRLLKRGLGKNGNSPKVTSETRIPKLLPANGSTEYGSVKTILEEILSRRSNSDSASYPSVREHCVQKCSSSSTPEVRTAILLEKSAL
ncbi:hypothetical protein TNCV_4730881 [Trichonephila clavipes]|nr:hypothetical protein TNCV_4730881 [Trichonephila clavipes]